MVSFSGYEEYIKSPVAFFQTLQDSIAKLGSNPRKLSSFIESCRLINPEFFHDYSLFLIKAHEDLMELSELASKEEGVRDGLSKLMKAHHEHLDFFRSRSLVSKLIRLDKCEVVSYWSDAHGVQVSEIEKRNILTSTLLDCTVQGISLMEVSEVETAGATFAGRMRDDGAGSRTREQYTIQIGRLLSARWKSGYFQICLEYMESTENYLKEIMSMAAVMSGLGYKFFENVDDLEKSVVVGVVKETDEAKYTIGLFG